MKNPNSPSCSFNDLMQTGPLKLKLGETIIGELAARCFSTGSIGYGFAGRVDIQLSNGKFAKMQAMVCFIVIKSNRSSVSPKQESGDAIPQIL